MRITKYGHACVFVESDSRSLLIDPGVWSEAEPALNKTDAVLITHQHFDHVDMDVVAQAVAARPGLPIYAPHDVAEILSRDERFVAARITGLAARQEFHVAGFAVRAFGGVHELNHPDIPIVDNLAYLIDEMLYHPGDSFWVPQTPVLAVLVPIAAPWLRMRDAISFVRSVNPEYTYPIHDAILNQRGCMLVDQWFEKLTDTKYQRLGIGDSVVIG